MQRLPITGPRPKTKRSTTLDHLCSAETQALRDKLLQASQDAQTASIVAQLKTTA